jgi:hypothetical protein
MWFLAFFIDWKINARKQKISLAISTQTANTFSPAFKSDNNNDGSLASRLVQWTTVSTWTKLCTGASMQPCRQPVGPSSSSSLTGIERFFVGRKMIVFPHAVVLKNWWSLASIPALFYIRVTINYSFKRAVQWIEWTLNTQSERKSKFGLLSFRFLQILTRERQGDETARILTKCNAFIPFPLLRLSSPASAMFRSTENSLYPQQLEPSIAITLTWRAPLLVSTMTLHYFPSQGAAVYSVC